MSDDTGPAIAIVSRIYLPEPGAASFRLAALARSLRDAGARVTVITSRPPRGHDGDVEATTGIEVRRAPVLRDRMGYVRGYLQYLSFDIPAFFRLLVMRRPNAVVVEPPPTTGAAVRLACFLRRVPYLYYAADIVSDAVQATATPRPVAAVVRGLERWAMGGAASVLSVSDWVTQRISEIDPRIQATTIGNGVDTTLFSSDGPREDSDRPYLLYAGTASEVHGATVFVDAFARAIEVEPRARLVFIGQGAERPAIERAALALPADSVLFLPRLSAGEAARWMRGARATLASVRPDSYAGSFPTKMYASAACGVRTIFAGTGPAFDFASANGVGWATPFDPIEVSRAMVSALASPASEKQRSELATWARSNVSLAAVADRAAAEVFAVLAQKGPVR